MIRAFLSYIKENNLFELEDPVLLAVSGGCDSMALMHLCWMARLPFEVAHINYTLRDLDSDLDQRCVESYCAERMIPCHTYRLSAEEKIDLTSGGLQDKARQLRYHWLEKIRTNRGLRYILTAHHAQDQAETILWHAMRGTGVRGLAGIPKERDSIRRPLLFAFPADLAAWLTQENVSWRTDLSNHSLAYTRNKIRHQLVPTFQDIWPGGIRHIAQVGEEIQDLLPFLSGSWNEFRQRNTAERWGISYFKSISWVHEPSTRWMLSWWLRPHGYTNNQIDNLRNALNSSETKVFIGSSGFHIWANRQSIWFAESMPVAEATEPFLIQEGSFQSSAFQITAAGPGISVDVQRIHWPLLVRSRMPGDVISLRGGRKKLSDLFIDQKVPTFWRDSWPVLVDANGIVVWVPGLSVSPHILAHPETVQTVKFFAEPWISP